jgi:hypothetical protein
MKSLRRAPEPSNAIRTAAHAVPGGFRLSRGDDRHGSGLAATVIDDAGEALRSSVERSDPIGVLDDRVDGGPLGAGRVALRFAVGEQLDDSVLRLLS